MARLYGFWTVECPCGHRSFGYGFVISHACTCTTAVVTMTGTVPCQQAAQS